MMVRKFKATHLYVLTLILCCGFQAAYAGVDSADLSITKTDGVTAANAGGQITYTIVATNNGPDDVIGATVTDTFPADLSCSWTCVASATSMCTAGPVVGDISDTIDLINAGTATYTAVCDIASNATGTLSNTATVASATSDPDTSNNSATDSDTVLSASADLSITKTDGVTSVVQGGSLTYTIVASNAGPSDVTGASLTDTLPADLTCTFTSVAAGGATGNTAAGTGDLAETLDLPTGSSVTYTVTCTVSATATGTLSNTASISSAATDPNNANNSATDDTTVVVVTLAAVPNPSVITQPVTFNYTVNGNAPTGNVTVSDGGVNSCTASVAAGSCEITFDALGTFNMTAAYAGDGNNVAANSTVVAQVVNEAGTLLQITSVSLPEPIPLLTDTTITFDLTVDLTLGTTVPTGTVTITDGVDTCVATLPESSCVIAFTSPGLRDLVATYSGDANFNGTTSAIFGTVVGEARAIPSLNLWGLMLLLMAIVAATFAARRKFS